MMDSLSEVREISRSGDIERALLLLKQMEEAGKVSTQLLTYKSILIRLGDGEEYSLEDAEGALLAALEIDEKYVEALTELGWYYFAIQDNAEKALLLFQRAAEIAKEQLSEAVVGVAKCLSEVASPQQALDYLKEAPAQAIDEETLQYAREEIEES